MKSVNTKLKNKTKQKQPAHREKESTMKLVNKKLHLKNTHIHRKKNATDQTSHFSTREVRQLDQMKGGNKQTHMLMCTHT